MISWRILAQDRLNRAIKEEADRSKAEADAIIEVPEEEDPVIAPEFIEDASEEAPVEELTLPDKPKKKRTGRPKGSKNKAKPKAKPKVKPKPQKDE